MTESNNIPLSLTNSLNTSHSTFNIPNHNSTPSPSLSDEHLNITSPPINSYNIKNLIDITSLNTQGNNNMAKILALSLLLGSRSLYCCNEVKQNIAYPFLRLLEETYLIAAETY